ncbi:hypothetical protein Q7P36_000722 [Cladosporium allicinum]
MNPRIEDLVPRCYRTVTNWINAEFLERKATIVRSIANAKGKVTISFDGWKANNDVLDLLRVVVHYLGDDYKVYNVVLAMRDTFADNATNNDKALQHLAERVTLDPVASRLRCAGHIFNLVCTAILFRVDEHALDDAQVVFESKQTEVIDEGDTSHIKILRLVRNGGIRWNSTYLMIERAMHLRDALTLYQSHEEDDMHESDLLTREDWEELAHLKDLLAPIYEVSIYVQSVGTTARALHNTLTSIEYLLHHLETRRQ